MTIDKPVIFVWISHDGGLEPTLISLSQVLTTFSYPNEGTAWQRDWRTFYAIAASSTEIFASNHFCLPIGVELGWILRISKW